MPVVGSIVVLDQSSLGHLALVLAVYEDSFKVVEQNYLGEYIVSERIIHKDYSQILGFVL